MLGVLRDRGQRGRRPTLLALGVPVPIGTAVHAACSPTGRFLIEDKDIGYVPGLEAAWCFVESQAAPDGTGSVIDSARRATQQMTRCMRWLAGLPPRR